MNQSKTPNITLYLFWFTVLVSWLVFIFMDANTNKSILQAETLAKTTNVSKTVKPAVASTLHSSAAKTENLSDMGIQDSLDENIIIPETPTEDEIKKQIESTESVESTDLNTESIQSSYQSKVSVSTEIQSLSESYSKTNDQSILPWLVKKLVKNYQFDEAYNYFNMMSTADQKSDPNLHLYLLLNQYTVTISSPDSIQSVVPVLEQYKSEWLLSDQEYKFYLSLTKIRYGRYDEASTLLASNTDPDLQSFIQSFKKAKSDFSNTKDVPSYYLDWLVSLSLMKNWYFSVAKKIALETLEKNNKYSLPYQVLAYTNFLTNNTEAAWDYFLKLSELDQSNQDSYKFLIWVSYFRANKYSESVLYLSQVDNDKLLTDTYRYLILAYEKLWDNENTSRYQQKLLWQSDIDKVDFYTYFHQTSFEPYSQWKEFKLYNTNQQLYILFLQKCELSNFQSMEKDVCLYGKIWFDLAQNALDSTDEKEIIYLSKKYSKSILYQIIWDIKSKESDLDSANSYYSKALKSTKDSIEKEVIKSKIANLSNPEKPLFSQK